ncbi:MAG: redoxin family protein [Planctomycetes bacterium]|nr:redoxin family protein [Planctomycetota bacterium]MCH9724094.1 redoxin family protein [Planctomycetota bacterium]MCH9778150.1 redoxin family protein [Planctomycetota bacterium]MDF1743461.1 redoxin family protein [Gimesia sp.]
MLIILTLGCSSQESSQSPSITEENPSQSAEANSPEIKPGKTVEITLIETDVNGFNELLEKQKGKVILVDFWATWCIPCVKNFHHTVEWNKKFADQGLTVISVSMDESDPETQKSVLQFLESKDAQFINILATAENDQDPMDTFEIDDGALPHYRIYDRTGKLIKKFSFADPNQQFTQADIESSLVETLKPKSE